MTYDPLQYKEVRVTVKKRSERVGVIGFILGTASFVALFLAFLAGPYMFWVLGFGVVLMVLAALAVAPTREVVDHVDLVPLDASERAAAAATASLRDDAARESIGRVEAMLGGGGAALSPGRAEWASIGAWYVTAKPLSLEESELSVSSTVTVRSSEREITAPVRAEAKTGTKPLSTDEVETIRGRLNAAVDSTIVAVGKQLGIVR